MKKADEEKAYNKQHAQELYNQFVKEHGCAGKPCFGCHCRFDRNEEENTYKCILVVLADAAGVKEAPPSGISEGYA